MTTASRILLILLVFTAPFLGAQSSSEISNMPNDNLTEEIGLPELAVDIASYLLNNPNYDGREYWNFAVEFGRGGGWHHLSIEHRESLFLDIMEDTSPLVKLHMDDACSEYFRRDFVDELSQLSYVLAIFGALHSFDPEISLAWTRLYVAMDDATGLEKRKQMKAMKKMGTAWKQACFVEQLSVQEAAITILSGPAVYN